MVPQVDLFCRWSAKPRRTRRPFLEAQADLGQADVSCSQVLRHATRPIWKWALVRSVHCLCLRLRKEEDERFTRAPSLTFRHCCLARPLPHYFRVPAWMSQMQYPWRQALGRPAVHAAHGRLTIAEIRCQFSDGPEGVRRFIVQFLASRLLRRPFLGRDRLASSWV